MRVITRLLIVAPLGWLVFVLFQNAHEIQQQEQPDGTQLFLYFGLIVLLVLAIGGVVGLAIVPLIGEQIGRFFYNPSETVERDPHAMAVAKIAQGDYAGAIAEYQGMVNKNPSDTLALSEMAKIYCDHLEEPQTAAELLEAAVQRDLAPADAGFLMSRLVDVYWDHMQDAIRARQLLIHIAETMPNTKFSANAVHRLREIDQALAAEE